MPERIGSVEERVFERRHQAGKQIEILVLGDLHAVRAEREFDELPPDDRKGVE